MISKFLGEDEDKKLEFSIPDFEDYDKFPSAIKTSGLLINSLSFSACDRFWLKNGNVVHVKILEKSEEKVDPKATYCIRPCIKYSSIKDYATIDENNERCVYFGEYPQETIYEMSRMDYDEITKEKTGKTYNIGGKDCIEVVYNGKKYAIEEYAFESLYSPTFKAYEVKPVEWYIIPDKDLVVAESGLGYSSFSATPNTPFEYSRVKKFLDNFAKDILTENLEFEMYASTEQKKIHKLVSEIKTYISKYDKLKYLDDEIKKIIDAYNKEIDDSKHVGGIQLVFTDETTAYNNLLVKLLTILDNIKLYESKIIDYAKMIDILKLNNQEDDLYNDLKAINDTIIPFLGNDITARKYKEFIDSEISRLNNLIDEVSLDNIKGNTTLDELKKDFRFKLQPYLTDFAIAVPNKNVISEIISASEDVINEEYKKRTNSMVSVHFNLINKCVNEIKANANESELNELNDIFMKLKNKAEEKDTESNAIFNVTENVKFINNVTIDFLKLKLKIDDRLKSENINSRYKVKI